MRKWKERVEAELFETGLSQAQVIEALAEELLDKLMVDATGEIDAALDECTEAVLKDA